MPNGDWTDVTFGMWGIDIHGNGSPPPKRPTEADYVKQDMAQLGGCLIGLLAWPFLAAIALLMVPVMLIGLIAASVHDAAERRRHD